MVYPAKKNQHLLDAIVRDRKETRSLREIAAKYNITIQAIWGWADEDPIFKKNLQEARVKSTELLEDGLLHVTDDAVTMADAAIARVKSDNIKSVLGYRRPEVYGARMNVEVNHNVDISKALNAAEARLSKVIDVKPLVDSDSATYLNRSEVEDAEIVADSPAVTKVEDLF